MFTLINTVLLIVIIILISRKRFIITLDERLDIKHRDRR